MTGLLAFFALLYILSTSWGIAQIDYGAARAQIRMLNLDSLHAMGFTGRGVKIAVFDDGFAQVNTLPAFDSLRLQNRLLQGYDFVDNDNQYFESQWTHGLHCLSIMAANLPGQYVGAAPGASYIPVRTEYSLSEFKIEEYNWERGMRFADSIGAFIISSSLGYDTFDDGIGNYTYADLDGKTAVITKAAVEAARRGILVVSSAGNTSAKILAPCDADSILCVGAVFENEVVVGFSGQGPTVDRRIKPEVMAMGGNTAIVKLDGVGNGSGTSYSCPLIAGLAACLKQAFPTASNMQIRQAIIESGDRSTMPDTIYGYGIPDAMQAFRNLNQLLSVRALNSRQHLYQLQIKTQAQQLTIGVVNLSSDQVVRGQLQVYDLSGQCLYEKTELLSGQEKQFSLPVGIYTACWQSKNGVAIARFGVLTNQDN
jgi:subtilisin family serine protease